MFRNRQLGSAVAVGLVVLGTGSAVFGYQNGRLPQSALAEIYHPTYTLYLENDARMLYMASALTGPSRKVPLLTARAR